MSLKYWQKLLTEWRRRNRNGLTIPYIIGSQYYLPYQGSIQGIDDLVLDIVTNQDIEVYITYCTDINELILGLRDTSKQNIAGYFPHYNNQPQSRLFSTLIVANLGHNVETIISSLTEKFQNRIDSETYSINNGEWGNYSSSEKRFIETCFTDHF